MRQPITSTDDNLFLIGPSTNFSEIWIKKKILIQEIAFEYVIIKRVI